MSESSASDEATVGPGKGWRRVVGQRKVALVLLLSFLVTEIAWRAFRVYVGSPRDALAHASWTYGLQVIARDGRVLGRRASPEGLSGVPTELDAVSPRLVAATLASEDRRFYAHDGVDRVAVARALASDVWHWRLVSGASTITAQLVKRVDYRGRSRPRTFAAKIVEMARAQNLEAALDKRAILEAYFDHVDYGHGYAGPEAAARGYFGVSAHDVSLAQAAFLAVIPRAPTALDPRRHVERTLSRQRALLASMNAHGEVSDEDYARAVAEVLEVRAQEPARVLAPHVVMAAAARRARAAQGGEAQTQIRTTLDYELQRDVEAIAASHALRLAEKSAKGVSIVVVDNASGDVLAEVGSASYFDSARSGAIDLARRRRQAGSTLKPFIYARAFETGVSPMAMLADVPTEYGTTGAIYAPDNFDGAFVGPVSAREALAGSLNVPAVRLFHALGAKDMRRVLSAAGIVLADGADHYGLSLALGSAEVSPLEMAAAYATLARGGAHLALRDRVEEHDAPATEATPVFSASSAALVADALSDPLARIRGLRARGPFEFSYPVALKTGTSTGYRDAWTAGFTRERTVVVWVGNPDGAPTDRLTGAVAAGPVFFDAMKRAMQDVHHRAGLYEGALLEEAEVCALSGERATDVCPDRVTRKFERGHTPDASCTVHRHVHAHAAAAARVPIACTVHGSDVAVLLPDAYARYLGTLPLGAPGADARGLPWYLASSAYDCSADEAGEPTVKLIQPKSGAVLHTSVAAHAEVLDVVAETRGLPRDALIDVLVDGALAAQLHAPYRASVPIGRGDHEIQLRPHDASVAARLAMAEISVR